MAAMIRMSEEDLNALRAAAATLEHPGLAARLGNIAGKPIELVGRALPEAASEAVAAATTKALHAALAVALRTMEKEPKAASRLLHKALAAASGAVGGGFGLAALPVELPISTIIMLRSIGDIARSEGEDLADPESALACLQVRALSGSARSSPSLRAMSPIDRNMMMVEIGSSSGNAARPKLPPTAPDAAANALCSRRDAALGSFSMVRSATASAAWSALVVAAATASDAASGSARPTSSIGLPAMLPRRAAKPGCSSVAAAARSALRSSSLIRIIAAIY